MTQLTSDNIKKWGTFNQLLESVPGLEVLARLPSTGEIYRIQSAILSGGIDSGEKWDSATAYNVDDVVLYNSQYWECILIGNIGSPPVAGSSYWESIPISASNGFGRYAPGLFTVDPSVVINGNYLYILSESVTLPFNSVDFATELAAGSWVQAGGNMFDSVILAPDYAPVSTVEGEFFFNGEWHTIEYNTGLGASIKVGQTVYDVFYNNTGVQIEPFTALHLSNVFDIGDVRYPTFELADSSDYEKIQGTLIISLTTTPIGSLGIGVRDATKITGGDSSLWPTGSQLFISDDGTGRLTNIRPIFPSVAISVGGNYNQLAAPNGEIFVNITSSFVDIYHESWDGSVIETFDFSASSNGTVVTGLLVNKNPLLNLTLNLSTGTYRLDTTTAPLTIALTAGTDALPQSNFVYVPADTKVLTISLSGWPTAEHVKIARMEVQSAVTVQAEGGCERNQNINDHIKKEDDNGHILHIAERLRQLNADHDNGTEATLTGTPTNAYIQVTGGEVWQLHKQVVPSFSMPTRNIIVQNDFTTPNLRINNLNTIGFYSDGSIWNNEWGKIVVWGIANRTGGVSFVKINKPSGGYNSEALAKADASKKANYSIPKKYKGVGFLIASFTVRISTGTVTYNGVSTGYEDLRGFIPSNIAGGGGGAGVTSLLALSDVFIASYAGKKGESVVINDLETGIVSEPKGRIYNALRNAYHTIVSGSSSGETPTFTLPSRDGTVSLSGEDAAYKFKFNYSTISQDQSPTYFAFNNVNGGSTTEIYISLSHIGAGSLLNKNNFVLDLKAGSYITIEPLPNQPQTGSAEFKLTADAVILGAGSCKLTVTNLYHQWVDGFESSNKLFSIGFHQVGGGSISVVPSDLEQWSPTKAYTAGDTYVSYVNAGSPDPQFQTEAIYRCDITTIAGESPETHPSKWAYLGTEIIVEDYGVKVSISDTTKGFLYSKIAVGEELTKSIADPGENESVLITFKNWFFNVARDFKLSFNLESLTADRVATWQNKDITVAGLDDIHPDPSITLSDETSDLVPAENDSTITLTRAQTFTAFSASVNVAPTAANILISVLLNGSAIATITILAGEFFGTTTTINTTSGVVSDKLKFDLTQVGATITGAGLKCYTLSNLV